MKPVHRTVLCAVFALVLTLAVCPASRAKVLVSDPGSDGIQYNPLWTYASLGTTFEPSDEASPFNTSRAFGQSRKSLLLTDNSTDYNAYATGTGFRPNDSDWVLLQFDFRLSSDNHIDWRNGEFSFDDNGQSQNGKGFELAVQNDWLGVWGRREADPGGTKPITFIPFPDPVFAVEDNWYHVEALFPPVAWPSAYRMFRVTVTQRDSLGQLRTATLDRLWWPYDDPPGGFTAGNFFTVGVRYKIFLDNLRIESLSSTTVVLDPCFDSSPAPVSKLKLVDGLATNYVASTKKSPMLADRFPTNLKSGDLNDGSNTFKARLRQETSPLGHPSPIESKDYLRAQFDVSFSGNNYDRWSFLFTDDSTPPLQQGANAFEMRVRKNSSGKLHLAFFGRTRTSDAPAYVLTNIPVDTSSWYRIEVLFQPSYLPPGERTYTVSVRWRDGKGKDTYGLWTFLNEDAGPIRDFHVLASSPVGVTGPQDTYGLWTFLNEDAGPIRDFHVSTNASVSLTAPHIYLDNVVIDRMRDLETELRYAYYPGARRARAYVPFAPYWAGTWEFGVYAASGTSPIATTGVQSFPFPRAGVTLDLSRANLTPGSYVARLTLGGSSVSAVTTDRNFLHRDFVWEDNGLGSDETIIVPPFKELQVDESDGTVSAVLRTHRMSTVGLWSEVTSQGIKVLSAPLSLKVLPAGGTPVSASGPRVTFDPGGVAPHRVAGRASWQAGPLKGITRFEFDYDGLMKVWLELEPFPVGAVPGLYLDIPLKDAEAKYLHVVTDYLRGHAARSIPAGVGKVWDSSAVFRKDLPAPFVPYVWVGGAERGVLFLAENDKDWSLDEKNAAIKPEIELVRTAPGDPDYPETSLVLRVWLFRTSPAVSRARTLEFALMATPAKPMPSQPTSWRSWWPYYVSSNPLRLTWDFLGADWYWGGQTPLFQHYPAFQDFGIFDEFFKTRARGKRTSGYVTNRMLQLFSAPQYNTRPDPYYPAANKTLVEQMTPSLNAAFDVAERARFADLVAPIVRDDMEGGGLRPLQFNDAGDARNTYNPVNTSSSSPFSSADFTAPNAHNLLLYRAGGAAIPFLARSDLGVTPKDWIRLAFDLRLASGSPSTWSYILAHSSDEPFAFHLGIQGDRFVVQGRRFLSEPEPATTVVPVVTFAPGTWYHVEVLLKPADSPPAERTYDLSIAQQNGDGSWQYGILRGILNEDTGAITEFSIRSASAQVPPESAVLQVDNAVLAKAKPHYVLPYTNPRATLWDAGSFQETETYLDEWSIYDPADPRWAAARTCCTRPYFDRFFRESAGGYDEFSGIGDRNDPVGSYADMVLHYQARMFDTFVNGIYWDNWFPWSSYKLVDGPGYVDDEGRLRPGVSWYSLRKLAKRAMIMQYQRGIRPLTYIHMTNTHVVPILSFATMMYDWEWTGPFAGSACRVDPCDVDRQDGFGLDSDLGFVFAEATGFQSGNLGVMLDYSGHGSAGQQDHLRRSELAIALVHEMKVGPLWQSDAGQAASMLDAFEYGDPEQCTVYRYWEGPQPVTASGATVKLLVVQHPDGNGHGRALVVVSGFDPDSVPKNVALDIQAATLDLPSPYRAWNVTNPPSGTPPSYPEITVSQNQLTVSVPRHEYRLIYLGSVPPAP